MNIEMYVDVFSYLLKKKYSSSVNFYNKQTIILIKKRLTVILDRIAMKILCDGCLLFCTKMNISAV